jgi:hypothetical protein
MELHHLRVVILSEAKDLQLLLLCSVSTQSGPINNLSTQAEAESGEHLEFARRSRSKLFPGARILFRDSASNMAGSYTGSTSTCRISP